MLKKNDSPTPRSSKGQKRRTVIALSVGTCLVMGILAMEVLRRQDTTPLKLSNEPKETLVILKNPDDLKLHRDLTLLESRIQDSKRLLFSKEKALETDRVKALRERLNHAEAYAQELEERHDRIKEALQLEKQKVAEYDRAQTALVDTIELHKNEKASGRQQLIAQIESLQKDFAEEKAALEKALRDQAASSSALRDEIAQKEQALAQMQDVSVQKESDIERHQSESARLHESRLGLSQEVESLRRELEDHAHTAASLEQELKRTHDLYAEKIDELNSRLERTESAYHDLNDSYATLLQRNYQLTAQLSEKEEALEHLATSMEVQKQDKAELAMASDQYTSHAATLLAEKEDALALEQAYSELSLYRMKQHAQKVEEDRQALEQNLQDLRLLLADKQNQAESLASLLERNKAETHELKQRLEVEKAQSEQLRFTLEHRPAERDLARETALENELAQEKEAKEGLLASLSEEKEAIQHVQKEIALLESALLESRSHSQGLSSSEQSLRQELATLEEQLQKERKEQEELLDKLSAEERSREEIKTRLAELQNEAARKGEGWNDREKQLQQESDQLAQALDKAREESEHLSDILAAERGRKEELEQEISHLNVRINNLGLSREDNEQSFRSEIEALNRTLADVQKEAETALASLQEEQQVGQQLRREIESLQATLAQAAESHTAAEGNFNAVIARMDQELQALKRALSNKEDEFAEAVAVKQEVQDTAAGLMRRLEALNQEKQLVEQEAQNRLKDYEGKIASLDESSADLQAALSEQSSQKALLEHELKELHARYDDVELEVSKLRYALQDLENKPPQRDTAKEEALQTELNAKEKELSDLKATLNTLEQKAEFATEQAQRHEETLSRLNESSELLQNSINRLAQEKSSLQESLDRLTRDYEIALVEADNAKKALKEWESRPIERDTAKEAALETQLREKEGEVNRMRDALDSLQGRVSKLSQDKEKLKNRLAKLKKATPAASN